ncbi:MAG TPA: hypothetical protein VMS43_02370 [Allosphingosinicella sp.]|nr:hypothetical protein [Allosphingosinicella sp.]
MSKFEDEPDSEGPTKVFFVPDEEAEALADEVIGELFDEVADAFDNVSDEDIVLYLRASAHVRPVMRFGRPASRNTLAELDMIKFQEDRDDDCW